MNSNYQTKFYVAYPSSQEAEANATISNLCDRLLIEYELWSYRDVEDEMDYFEKNVSPAIEKAEFVIALVEHKATNDFLLTETCRLCSNLNKRILPIKIGSGRVKPKDWKFRSDILDFSDTTDRISIVEQMHSWLGLQRVGDIYGSRVTLSSNVSCTVKRGDMVIAQLKKGEKNDCILAKGRGNLTFATENDWNQYEYTIPDNDSHIEFEASLCDNLKLRKMQSVLVISDISSGLETDWNWDRTWRNDFELVASSQDQSKRSIIISSFEHYYQSQRSAYPDFEPDVITYNTVLEVITWVIALGISFISPYIYGALLIFLFYKIRKKRDNNAIKRNSERYQSLIEYTENANVRSWENSNSQMNKTLHERHLTGDDLIYLGPTNNRPEFKSVIIVKKKNGKEE